MFSAKRKNICFSNGCGSIYLSLSLKSLSHQVLGTLCNRHQSCSLWIHCFIAYSINRYASLLQTLPFATYQPPYFAVQNEVLLFKIISTHNRISSLPTHPAPKLLSPKLTTENCCVEEAPANSQFSMLWHFDRNSLV